MATINHLLATSSLEHLTAIQVVVLPVGVWRRDVYEQVVEHFTGLTQHVARKSLTLKSNIVTAVKSRSSTSPMKHPSSASFIRCAPVPLTPAVLPHKSEDEALRALLQQFASYQHPEYEELHVYKRLLAVVGVIDCQSTELADSYQLYTRVKEQLRHSNSNNAWQHGFPPLRYQCYAFDCKSPAPLTAGDLALMHSDQLDYYLQPNVNELISTLLYDFERMSTSLASHSWLKTPLDSNLTMLAINSAKEMNTVINADDTGQPPPVTAPAAQSNTTMIASTTTAQLPLLANSGRQAKYVADLCLLAGSWKDAQKHYKRAVDIAAQTKDSLWHAAALEGQAAATLVRQLEKSSYGTAATISEVIEYYSQALGRYAQLLPASAVLLVQAASRLMQYLIRICSTNNNIITRTNEINHLVMICYDAVTCVTSVDDRAQILRHLANICNTLHFHRKASLMMMQAARFQLENDHVTEAHTSLLLVLHQYGVCLCDAQHGVQAHHDSNASGSNVLTLDAVADNGDLAHSPLVKASTHSRTPSNNLQQSNGHTHSTSPSSSDASHLGIATPTHVKQSCPHLRPCQWQSLQVQIVDDLIECASHLNFSHYVQRYVLHQLMSTHHNSSAAQQQQLIDKLLTVNVESAMAGPPMLDITPLQLIQSIAVFRKTPAAQNTVQHSYHQRRFSAPTSPTTVNLFEFHPTTDSRRRMGSDAVEADATLTTDEDLQIEIALYNPLQVTLEIVDTQLLYGDTIDPHPPHSLTLPTQSSHTCTLTTRTSSHAGYLAIKSATFTLFNTRMLTYLPTPYIVMVTEATTNGTHT